MSMSKQEVIKSSWVIHISHELSLLQQKLWNILLAYAYDNLLKQDIHCIDVRILCFYLGKNRSIQYLQKTLSELCEIESFNLINKTNPSRRADGAPQDERKVTRNKFRLLSSAVIEDGICRYAFSNDLIPQLVNPPSYTKINLLMQSKFKSKYSLIIYELCKDYMHIDRTPMFTLEKLKTYLGIAPHEYTIFKHFNYKVIKKSISEINKLSDLSIAVKFDVKNGVDIVWFEIKKKTRTIFNVHKLTTKATKKIPHQNLERCPFMRLKEHGVSHQKATQIFSMFSLQEVQKVMNEVQRDIEKIMNPAALIAKIFNDKEKERAQKIKTGSRKINTADDAKIQLQKDHKIFVDNRVKELLAQLDDDRKRSIDASYEEWVIERGLPVNLVGRSILYSLFIEQVLLLPQEKNFDEWIESRNIKNCNSL